MVFRNYLQRKIRQVYLVLCKDTIKIETFRWVLNSLISTDENLTYNNPFPYKSAFLVHTTYIIQKWEYNLFFFAKMAALHFFVCACLTQTQSFIKIGSQVSEKLCYKTQRDIYLSLSEHSITYLGVLNSCLLCLKIQWHHK